MANVIPIDRVTAKSVNTNNPNPTKLVRKEYFIALPVAVKGKESDISCRAPPPSKDGTTDICWQAPSLSKDGVSDNEWSPQDCRQRECQLKIE